VDRDPRRRATRRARSVELLPVPRG
jgi:hypothetical protein